MNCVSSPAVMFPAITSRAPAHSTPTMQEKAPKITTAVITARARVRTMATAKLLSTVP
jgi:hypothetical protein